MSSAGSATLETVAREARVSTATVSRFFNSPDVVAARTAARIRGVVERTGYVPNLLAGGLASSRSRLIAIAMPRVSQPLYASTIQAIADALVGAGYAVLLGLTGAANEHVERQLLSIVGRRPDGIILAGTPLDVEMRRWLRNTGIAAIEIWDLPRDPVDLVVGFSHAEVGRSIAQHVLGRGRRRALVIAAEGTRARVRRDAFVQAMKAAGAPDPVLASFELSTRYRHGRSAVALHLDSGGTPDVIVCSSDWSAHGAIDELRSRGLRVPADVAVVGFGDLEFSSELIPSLTTVHIDGDAIGRHVLQFLQQRAQGKKVQQPVVDIGFSLVLRESG